jgi:hypothetical protein
LLRAAAQVMMRLRRGRGRRRSAASLGGKQEVGLSDLIGLLDRINSHQSAYLTYLGEPRDNVFTFRIEEARLGAMDAGEASRRMGLPAIPSAPIVANDQTAAYDVSFSSYVAYCVRDETYVAPNDYDEFTGRICGTYTKSYFREFVERATYAMDDNPGPLRHYGFNCLNHIVDVLSAAEPVVTVVRSGAA